MSPLIPLGLLAATAVASSVMVYQWQAGVLARCELDNLITTVDARDRAQSAADQLAMSLADAAALRQQVVVIKQGKLKREITKNTQGVACFSAATVGLLNTAPGISPDDVPGTSGVVIEPDAAVASSASDAVSDADVAFWVIEAAGQYEACRARIDALREWHDGLR